uniref:Tick transposon n=1 Tax=Rhipicephalus appendiculatus TaxID=34631 RepID=A0A131YK91_RHIAP
MVAVAQKLKHSLRTRDVSESVPPREKRKKIVAMPLLHQVSHNLKRTGKRAGVEVVFSAPKKLAGMCKKVNRRNGESHRCSVRHVKQFVERKKGVIYSLPLSCGKQYVGQTGRCINQRLKEHHDNVARVATCGHVAEHCRDCRSDENHSEPCEPMYRDCNMIGKHRDALTREIQEAHVIAKLQDMCISAPLSSIVPKRNQIP